VLAYPSEADLVAKVVEAADTVLGIFEVVVLDEPKAICSCQCIVDSKHSSRWTYPLHS
jgi:hypothetical protein